MNKDEALNYLNLLPGASELEKQRVFSEKFNHFQYLLTHAPNDLLRNIHRQNLEQLEQVRQLLGISQPGVNPTPLSVPKPVQEVKIPSVQSNTPHSSGSIEPVAWLIRHTENKSHSHFSLWPGENPIGRTVVVNRRSICIDDDPYISRSQAVIIVSPGQSGFSFEIADDGRYNNGISSRNGTYLNGNDKPIKPNEPRQLKDGDTIQVGTTKLVLRLNAASKSISGLVREVEKTQFVRTIVIDL
jgi:hypothetical protein